MNDIDPLVFFASLDKAHTSPEGVRLLTQLGISEADFEENPMETLGHRLYEDEAKGLHLDFIDEGKHRNTPMHDVGEGPWVLFQYFFMSGIAGTGRYAGRLPYDIAFDMTRADLAKLLGAPTTSNPMVETWQRDGHRIGVNFDRKSGAIKTVSIQGPLE